MTTRTVKHHRRARRVQRTRAKRKGKRSSGNPTFGLSQSKMSEVIWRIADPIVEELSESQEDTEEIIRLTAAAWNVALLPEEKREKERIRLTKKLLPRRLFGLIPFAPDKESVDFFRNICEVVSRGKRQLYPNLNHFILDVQFQPVEKGVYFEVMYALDWHPE